jgi:carbamate kinase
MDDRTVIALGGNAIAPPGGGSADEQIANVSRAMGPVATLIADGVEVILTHGNGPQVGNLLIKNELARHIVPAMPLDWCVAQTQATIGYTIVTALERELAARGLARPIVPVITRVLVDANDPAWDDPSKPIGPFVEEAEARRRMDESPQTWKPAGDRGWRRVVPSPEPMEILDRGAIRLLLEDGAVVVAAGGGGIPMVWDDHGRLHGVEAVIDKDLAGARLAQVCRARRFVILTDVEGAALHYGTPREEWIGEIEAPALRELQAAGHFASGSMGPKIEAVLRFVEGSGGRAVIGSLERAAVAVRGKAGTQVLPGSAGAAE